MAAAMAVGIVVTNTLDSTITNLSIIGAGGDYIAPYYVPASLLINGSKRIIVSSLNISNAQGTGIETQNISSNTFSNISMTATG